MKAEKNRLNWEKKSLVQDMVQCYCLLPRDCIKRRSLPTPEKQKDTTGGSKKKNPAEPSNGSVVTWRMYKLHAHANIIVNMPTESILKIRQGKRERENAQPGKHQPSMESNTRYKTASNAE